MKNLVEYINPVNEGWTGVEGDKAYDKILEVVEGWKPEQILTLIWNYYSDKELKNLYKWMEQDGYFDE
mgnify:CR=1 FL=1